MIYKYSKETICTNSVDLKIINEYFEWLYAYMFEELKEIVHF